MSILRNLEMRVARLERQATTKSEAYDALKGFLSQNRNNTRMIVELGGYLQTLKDGGDLSERDLKTIRKMMHRNNASDLADSFRSNPTGRQPSPRVVQQPSTPRPVRQRTPTRSAPRSRPTVEEQLPTAQEVYDFLCRSSTPNGSRMDGVDLIDDGDTWLLDIEPMNRHRLDHYVGFYHDCDEDDEDCDPDGWDEEAWWDDWAGPLTNDLKKLLTRKYPIFQKLKSGYGEDYVIDIGEKGYILINLSKSKFKRR